MTDELAARLDAEVEPPADDAPRALDLEPQPLAGARAGEVRERAVGDPVGPQGVELVEPQRAQAHEVTAEVEHCARAYVGYGLAVGGNDRARLVGMNHLALEVDDIDEALEFYGRIFSFTLRGRIAGMAFIDMGDQFLAFAAPRTQPPDAARHCGLVVDDKEVALRRLHEEGVAVAGNDFRDPWGNFVQVVEYGEIQFTKAPEILRGMGLGRLEKSERALAELREKGLAPG